MQTRQPRVCIRANLNLFSNFFRRNSLASAFVPAKFPSLLNLTLKPYCRCYLETFSTGIGEWVHLIIMCLASKLQAEESLPSPLPLDWDYGKPKFKLLSLRRRPNQPSLSACCCSRATLTKNHPTDQALPPHPSSQKFPKQLMRNSDVYRFRRDR